MGNLFFYFWFTVGGQRWALEQGSSSEQSHWWAWEAGNRIEISPSKEDRFCISQSYLLHFTGLVGKWKWIRKECCGKRRNTYFLPNNTKSQHNVRNVIGSKMTTEECNGLEQETKVRGRISCVGWIGGFLFAVCLLWGVKLPPLLSLPTTILRWSWQAVAACQRTGSALIELNRNKGRSSLPKVSCSPQLALQTAPCRANPLSELCVPRKGNATTIHVSLPLHFFFSKWQWMHTELQLQKIMGFNLVCAVKLY